MRINDDIQKLRDLNVTQASACMHTGLLPELLQEQIAVMSADLNFSIVQCALRYQACFLHFRFDWRSFNYVTLLHPLLLQLYNGT